MKLLTDHLRLTRQTQYHQLQLGHILTASPWHLPAKGFFTAPRWPANKCRCDLPGFFLHLGLLCFWCNDLIIWLQILVPKTIINWRTHVSRIPNIFHHFRVHSVSHPEIHERSGVARELQGNYASCREIARNPKFSRKLLELQRVRESWQVILSALSNHPLRIDC